VLLPFHPFRIIPNHPDGLHPSAWLKSCHPPSGIGARFATAEALASPRSNPTGIPNNSVVAFPSFRIIPFRPDGFSQARSAVFPQLQAELFLKG